MYVTNCHILKTAAASWSCWALSLTSSVLWNFSIWCCNNQQQHHKDLHLIKKTSYFRWMPLRMSAASVLDVHWFKIGYSSCTSSILLLVSGYWPTITSLFQDIPQLLQNFKAFLMKLFFALHIWCIKHLEEPPSGVINRSCWSICCSFDVLVALVVLI